ncbi:spore cortex biosynthesis protein YabQ [Virgibacillus kimchii]
MTLSTQFITMIAMTSGGFYLGLVLDTFRRFSSSWKHRVIFPYVMETSFWLMQTIILFYVLFRVNGGELRLYIFLACLLGFAIYQVFAARLYKKLLERIILVIKAIYRFMDRLIRVLIIHPIRWLLMLIISIILGLYKVIISVLSFLFRVIFTPIRWVFQGFYQLLPKRFKIFLNKIAGFYSTMKNICNKIWEYIKRKRR